jgi:hypothetical protein
MVAVGETHDPCANVEAQTAQNSASEPPRTTIEIKKEFTHWFTVRVSQGQIQREICAV